ncbi:MAG: hypothetical protein ACRD5Z_22365, partial [Bryobacteraceae bacterium]
MHWLASATKRKTSERDRTDSDSQKEDEVAKINLTYSHTASISYRGAALQTLTVCIIQVQECWFGCSRSASIRWGS